MRKGLRGEGENDKGSVHKRFQEQNMQNIGRYVHE